MTAEQPVDGAADRETASATDDALAARLEHVAQQGRVSVAANVAIALIIAGTFLDSVAIGLLAGWACCGDWRPGCSSARASRSTAWS